MLLNLRKSVSLITATALALMMALSAATTPSRVAYAAPSPQPGTWPFWRYDLQRTNRVPPTSGSAQITQPAIKWTYLIGGASNAWVADVTGPAGLPDGQPEIIAYGGGRVRAFNPRNAESLWVSDLIPSLQTLTFVGDVDANGSVEILAFARSAQSWQVYVLAGATGRRLSRITATPGGAVYPPIVVDANGDGKAELFETGAVAGTTPTIFTFLNGASAPSVVAEPALLGTARMPVIGDLNGDGTREVVYPADGRTLHVVQPSNWSVVVSTTLTTISGTYPTTILADVLTAQPGLEIVTSWTTGGSGVGLYKVGAAPSFPLTVQWVSNAPNTPALAASVAVANLDGVGDREIIWSYYDNALNQSVTRIIAGSGATLQTIIGEALCSRSLFASWKNDLGVTSVANLDADPSDELVLCLRPTAEAQAAAFKVYDWSGTSLSFKWAGSGEIVGWNELASVRPEMTQRQPRFTADFDNDGVPDMLVRDGFTLRALRGDTGAQVFAYDAGMDFSLQYLGNIEYANTLNVLLATADGYLRVLDRTLQIQRSVYAGTGTSAPYVINSNGDDRNEVVLTTAAGDLVNLDPYTATQQAPPRTNWALPLRSQNRAMINFWHPLNIDAAGEWEYPIVDRSQSPTRTLLFLSKNPLSGVEQVVASYVFTSSTDIPTLHGIGDFAASNGLEIFLSQQNGYFGVSQNAFVLQGGSGTLSPLWPVANWRIARAARPGAIADANNDGRDDIAWTHNLTERVILNGLNGVSIGSIAAANLGYQPVQMIGNVDGDGVQEAVFAASVGENFLVAELTPSFTQAFQRHVADASPMLSALADASLSEAGLEILYSTGGVLGAMSGINGNDIYTRALGVAFNTVTCESFINIPASYLGSQLATLEALCPGGGRFARINDLVVADVDGNDGGRDEILAGSDNGYLYALNAETGSLLWGYNFYYPVQHIVVANIDTDPQLEILVSVADGFLYALEQETFPRPQSAWDGPSPVFNDDIDVQVSQTCYTGHWRVTSDPQLGPPDGYRVALRDAGGALMTNGYVNVTRTTESSAQGVQLCVNSSDTQRRLVSNLIPGQRYFLEVISYKGARASAPILTDGVLIGEYGSLEKSEKTVSPATTTPSSTLTWQVVVRNDGLYPSKAQVIDPIPMNTTYLNGSANATFGTVSYNAGQNRIEWSSGDMSLAAGQVVTITFQTQVNSGFSGGLIQNTAQIINLDNGLTTLHSAAAAVGSSNLTSAVKTVDRAQALLGDVLTYTIWMTNTGTLTASGMLLSDPLPAGTSFVAGSLSSVGGNGAPIYDDVLRRVTWSGSLDPGQVLQVQFRAQVNTVNAVLDNCATINDVMNGSFQRCARTVVGSGGPSLVGSLKTSDRLIYATSDTIVYTITLLNDGTQAATMQMRDDMPAGVTVQSAVVIPNGYGILSFTPNRVTWSGALDAGNVVRIVIAGAFNRTPGVMVNHAVVTDVTSSRVYTLTREVLVGTTPALNLEKFAEPAVVQTGDEITYVLRLQNTGNMPAASAVLTDPLPVGTSYVAGSEQASVGTVSYNATQQQLEWSGPVFITAPTFITWRVKVELAALAGFPIVNAARSHDGLSDYDETVALTAVNVPPGKALIRTYVFSGTGTTPMAGVLVSAGGLVTVTGSTNASGYAGLLVDALVTPTNYAVFQVVPAGFVNLTPNPVGVVGVTEGGVYDVVFRNAVQAPPGFGWVRGVVFHDVNGDGLRNLFSEAGLANVTVSASDGQTMQTLVDGSYFFLLATGVRDVKQVNLAGWVSTTPDVVTVNVLSQGAHEVNFGDWQCPPGSPVCDPPPPGYARLYGYVYEDADAALNLPDGMKGPGDVGLALMKVQANAGMISDTTDTSGLYYMDVPVGLVSVALLPPQSAYMPLSPNNLVVNAPEGAYLRVDFALISIAACGSGSFGVVNGFVYSDTLQNGQLVIGIDGPTLTEAAVTLGSEMQYTNWMYAFPCVATGSMAVGATNPSGYTNTTPNEVIATVTASEATRVDFGKAYQGVPIALRYAYVPIVRKE